MRQKLSAELFIELSIKKHSENKKLQYGYDKTNYIDTTTKVEIFCLKCEEYFWQNPNVHRAGLGHNKCNGRALLTQEQYIKKCNNIHNANEIKYTYEKVNYINSETKIEIYCNFCHEYFWQRAGQHSIGAGCLKCAHREVTEDNKISREEFLDRVKILHGDKYNYDNVKRFETTIKINIFCNTCKEFFTQKVSKHLSGQGCAKCYGNKLKTHEQFMEQAKLKHGDKFDLSQVVYTNSRIKIIVKCNICNSIFKKYPLDHLRTGCGNCNYTISEIEREWLAAIGVPDDPEHRQVYIRLKGMKYKIKVDGFDSVTNTIYEFLGDFWHGNPDKFNAKNENARNKIKFGDLYQKSLKREELIKQNNYNYVYIWESEWIKQRKISTPT